MQKKYFIRILFATLIFLAFIGFFTKRLRPPGARISQLPDTDFDSGIVITVYDGDTVKVRFKGGIEKKVRLIGVDAPEIKDQEDEDAFFAHLARRFSFYHLYQKRVKLTYDLTLVDSYGRVLAYIWKDGFLFNDFIIREGFASAFLVFPLRMDYEKRFRDSEEYARKEGKGLWREGDFPQINLSEVRDCIGSLVSVEYRCSAIERKRGFVFLQAPSRMFAALIPDDCLSRFPEARYFLRKNLVVSGFIEEYLGQPQIVVCFSCQIEIRERSSFAQ